MILAPTLVLWGDTDRVIDVSSTGVFEAGISDCSVVVMPQTGHVPMIERPEATAEHYLAFLTQQTSW